jgi:hypothetical protein
MTTIFLLCHEGELPYVLNGLHDILRDFPSTQILASGSTEKMYMGYLLLTCDEAALGVLEAELRRNPDVYLYILPDADEPDEDSEQVEESELPAWVHEPVPVES